MYGRSWQDTNVKLGEKLAARLLRGYINLILLEQRWPEGVLQSRLIPLASSASSRTSAGTGTEIDHRAADTAPTRDPCPAPAAPPTIAPEPGSADEDDPGAVRGEFLGYLAVAELLFDILRTRIQPIIVFHDGRGWRYPRNKT